MLLRLDLVVNLVLFAEDLAHFGHFDHVELIVLIVESVVFMRAVVFAQTNFIHLVGRRVVRLRVWRIVQVGQCRRTLRCEALSSRARVDAVVTVHV